MLQAPFPQKEKWIVEAKTNTSQVNSKPASLQKTKQSDLSCWTCDKELTNDFVGILPHLHLDIFQQQCKPKQNVHTWILSLSHLEQIVTLI